MLMVILLFVTGLILSGISAVYSVVGMIAIFSASPLTITLMTSTLELSKLVIASWLYRNWNEIPKFLKVYFSSALIVLMIMSSMAIFGYLSKAHLDSSIESGGAVSSLSIIDDKIATQKENILQYRKSLSQMDSAVNEMLNRTSDDQGATKSVKIRKSQSSERDSIAKDISFAQSEISRLQNERAPIAASVRKVEAEVGPIRYIANLIYGDKIDDTILEKAVRVVILMIVFVFDPLAVLMLIAANWQLKKIQNESVVTIHNENKIVQDDSDSIVVHPENEIKVKPDEIDEQKSLDFENIRNFYKGHPVQLSENYNEINTENEISTSDSVQVRIH